MCREASGSVVAAFLSHYAHANNGAAVGEALGGLAGGLIGMGMYAGILDTERIRHRQ
jgi:hypothetical protein